MNKKIIIMSLVIAFLFGVFMYTSYNRNSASETIKEKIYFIQIGAYKNADNVAKVTKMVSYNYVEKEDGIYYIYVGITKDEEVLNKLKEIYINKGNDVYIKEKEISNSSFLDEITKYDNMIKETNNMELIDSMQSELLNKYKRVS